MNDRAVGVFENYEIEVFRTWKGRGSLLCESDKGLLILKEYVGSKEKIDFQDTLLTAVKKQGFDMVETILRTKEGMLYATDKEENSYILKTYFDGRECNVRDEKECLQAVKTLASLHNASHVDYSIDCFNETDIKNEFNIDKEYEKHNKELRKVRKFLKEKSQKNNFEIFLMKNYDYFFDFALQIAEEVRYYLPNTSKTPDERIICHGDYQYHNILLTGEKMAIINFEKCMKDSPMRDLYLFMRKLLEKNNWEQELGDGVLSAYNSVRKMSEEDYRQLYYRFAYPEKFWKIVNFYFNSGKAWIPGRNLEKLEKLLEQEPDKIRYLENFKNNYRCFSFD